jgi:hypothetical protein
VKTADRECEPADRSVTVSVATPLDTVATPSSFEPSKKLTDPAAPDAETLAVSVILLLCAAEPAGLAVSVVVVLTAEPWFTTNVTASDVDPLNDDEPLGTYFAVRVCVPTASDEVVNAAVPPDRVTVLSTVVPSRNSTVPNAFEGDTVAVIVTAVPDDTGLVGETVSVVVVEFVGWTTVSETVLDVEDIKAVESVGVNVALRVCVPTESVLIPNVAVPADTVPTPICVVPSKKAT